MSILKKIFCKHKWVYVINLKSNMFYIICEKCRKIRCFTKDVRDEEK